MSHCSVPADCPMCGKPKKDHSFKQLKECWHKAKGYEPNSYKPEKRYKDSV